MTVKPTILIAEDDDGHAFLIEESLKRGNVDAPTIRFCDGQEILDFLFRKTTSPAFDIGKSYLLLLDIRMPKVDGVEVLRQIKTSVHLRRLPIIVLTTTDDPHEIDRCHQLGCNNYIQKPLSYESFSAVISKMGQFLSLLKLPSLAHDR